MSDPYILIACVAALLVSIIALGCDAVSRRRFLRQWRESAERHNRRIAELRAKRQGGVMRDLYARLVLTLIRPALALKERRDGERWQAVQHAAAVARDQQIKARCARWQAERASRPPREPDDAADRWVDAYGDMLGIDPEIILPPMGEAAALRSSVSQSRRLWRRWRRLAVRWRWFARAIGRRLS